ncbi:MAG: hypothetical protein MZV63_58675 [Marinilabiliales bacterium]|nr:hypothetical protein [Marinilabiliales bacterium]
MGGGGRHPRHPRSRRCGPGRRPRRSPPSGRGLRKDQGRGPEDGRR